MEVKGLLSIYAFEFFFFFSICPLPFGNMTTQPENCIEIIHKV